ncbi:phage tail tape measure protein [Marinifilum flexuosum]|uniref:Minor tail protein n=1 Tax=Marinifilum flexuosum TaxID=1117708 RepID=A0A419X3N0_9BACT|nr:phage tail tape measure protein [Marinifilum flexuosum]RKE02303.1 minor tail protein [Marinifilum flexuosum]
MSDKTYKYVLDFAAKTDKFRREVSGIDGMLKSAAVAAGALFAADKIFDTAGAAAEYAGEISTIRQSIVKLQDIQGAALNEAAGGAMALANTYDADVNESIEASNVLMKVFKENSQEAFDVLNKGLSTAANSNGDLLNQIKEYSTHFEEAEISASQMVAIIAEANKMGVWDDKAADAIKEGTIRLREMTKATREALDGIGLSSSKIQQDIASGSTSMFEVLQQVSAKLGNMEKNSPAVGAALADIFAGPGEDGIQFIRTLANINTNLDQVVENSGESSAAQQAWAEQLKEFHTLGAKVFADWNKWILDIKSKALALASGIVNNMDSITKVVKIGAVGFGAYKAATIAASVGTVNYSRVLVRARKAQQALNLAMKSNPVGLIAGLLATAAAAYLTYSIDIDTATASQRKFNEAQERGASLLSDVSAIEDTYKVINHLNKRQLEDFKVRAQQQLQTWEDVQKKVTETVYQEYRKRKSAISKETDEITKKLMATQGLQESAARREAEKTTAWKVNQLRRWFNDSVEKQEGVTSKEIVENQTRLKNYISTVNEMLNANTKASKNTAPILLDFKLNIDDGDDEVIGDDLEIDDSYDKLMERYGKQVKAAQKWNEMFGNSFNANREEIELTKQAIEALIDEGFAPGDASIQSLIEKLDLLEKKFTGPQKAMAQFAARMEDMKTTGAESFGDLAKAAVNAAREIIRAYIAEGVASIIKDALKYYGWTGPGAIALAGGLGAAASTLFNTMIPAFADGAIVSGPTVALTGEYPNAVNNPEWIGKRSDMLGDMKAAVRETGGGGGNFIFRFENGALVAYLEHENRKVGGFA